ncbi:ABC transporter substrate-binding protein [Pseudonocardia parietis]|uniref:Peptide/nickel transport system substrate-binding protein n=1 Tax=Pseudonocardia parietis TaxID=570936 RepID=A0ABS4VYC2_9PSEU|nr:ABC transporter substrate-binding protein [Pseudonocardia parietis]MBP2368895.1 peptide/nickel transport system substrate-binding protein [Pseudonocardia parietis]
MLAAAALVLTSCAGGGGVAGSAAAGADADAGAGTEPVQGGSATVVYLNEPRTLDPTAGSNNTPGNAIVGNALYGTLLITDPETGEIAPSMASSFSTPDDGKTFELTLRDGLTFSDGSPFEASAIKAQWERHKDPAAGSSYFADANQVESIEVTSPTTLRATMATPVPNFGYSIVTSGLNWIPKPEALAAGAEAFDENPIGAGPFTLQEWRRQDAMVLVKNPAYWDAPRPYLDQLTVRAVLDASQRINTVISGGADVGAESSWENVQKAKDAGLVTDIQPLSGGNYLALNMRRAPFDDIRAREAVAAALDPEGLNVSVYTGAAELVDTLFAPTSPFRTDIPTNEPDPARAQELFDELAAEGKPVSFTFTSTSNSESRATGEAIQAQLSAFRNVTVEVKTIDFAELRTLQSSKDFDATVSSAAFLDPEPRMWTAFQGDSPVNMSGIDDPQLNEALLKGRTSTTVEDRKAAYTVVQERLKALHPNIWMTRNASTAVSGTHVGGLTQYGYGSLRPEMLWVQE